MSVFQDRSEPRDPTLPGDDLYVGVSRDADDSVAVVAFTREDPRTERVVTAWLKAGSCVNLEDCR